MLKTCYHIVQHISAVFVVAESVFSFPQMPQELWVFFFHFPFLISMICFVSDCTACSETGPVKTRTLQTAGFTGLGARMKHGPKWDKTSWRFRMIFQNVRQSLSAAEWIARNEPQDTSSQKQTIWTWFKLTLLFSHSSPFGPWKRQASHIFRGFHKALFIFRWETTTATTIQNDTLLY